MDQISDGPGYKSHGGIPGKFFTRRDGNMTPETLFNLGYFTKWIQWNGILIEFSLRPILPASGSAGVSL
jgi:hypothetical protein